MQKICIFCGISGIIGKPFKTMKLEIVHVYSDCYTVLSPFPGVRLAVIERCVQFHIY
ncbi:conserved hypothetical protein, partial [delta proteobacterium NaphS2]